MSMAPGELVPRSALRQILNPAQLNKLLTDPKAVGPIVPIPFKFTAAIVPSARVLNIMNPAAVEGSQFSESDIPVTLDLTPADAQAVTYALVSADLVNLGLLPPENSDGYKVEASLGVSYGELVGAKG